MTRYKVTARMATIPSGVVALSAEQARPRRHNLAPLGSGRYEVMRPVELKAGEEFGYEGDLPKSLAESMDEIEEPRRAKPRPTAATEE